jgi:hypothetical protein
MAALQAALNPLIMQLILDSSNDLESGAVPFELLVGLLMCILTLLIDSTTQHGPKARRGRRIYWVFPRQKVTWDTLHKKVWVSQSPEVRDREWRETYRMSYPHFLQLVQELTPFLSDPESPKSRFRESMEPYRIVAAVLYRLAHGYAPKQVANMFGMGKSTLIFYTQRVTKILAGNLYSRYISIPSGTRLLEVISEFKELTGLDNMCGAIDGSHIKLRAQPDRRYTPADYWCRHHIHSILLQGVCTARCLF